MYKRSCSVFLSKTCADWSTVWIVSAPISFNASLSLSSKSVLPVNMYKYSTAEVERVEEKVIASILCFLAFRSIVSLFSVYSSDSSYFAFPFAPKVKKKKERKHDDKMARAHQQMEFNTQPTRVSCKRLAFLTTTKLEIADKVSQNKRD